MRTMSGGPCQHFYCSNRNSFGYCKTTVCINELYQQEQWGSPLTTNKSESVVKKPQTNADLIRGKDDEGLAEFIYSEKFLTHWCDMDCSNIEEPPCKECILRWLKQEVE